MQPEPVRGNVFVANLARGTTDEQLAELFDPFGVVLRAYVARDPATGETLAHGLVELAPDEAVEAAVSGVAAGPVEVRRADPDMSLPAPARPASRTDRMGERSVGRPVTARPAAQSAAPRFAVEHVRAPSRPQTAVASARHLPKDGPALERGRERPTLRLSLPRPAAAAAAGAEPWR